MLILYEMSSNVFTPHKLSKRTVRWPSTFDASLEPELHSITCKAASPRNPLHGSCQIPAAGLRTRNLPLHAGLRIQVDPGSCQEHNLKKLTGVGIKT